MKFLHKIWPVFLSLVVIGAIGLASFCSIRFLWRTLVSLDEQIAVGIIAGSATILVSVITVVIGKQLEKKREIEQQHRIQKIEIYEHFMEEWFKILRTSSTRKRAKYGSDELPISEENLLKFLEEFSRKLILWGSRGVIKQYVAFRSFGIKSGQPDPQILLHFENVLLAIRKDLGHSNRGLNQGDLLALFLKDLENLKQLITSSPNIVSGHRKEPLL